MKQLALSIVTWMDLEGRSLRMKATLDVFGLFLPLAGAWILFMVAIPALKVSVLTTGGGRLITDGSGRQIVTAVDRRSVGARQEYFGLAIPAMILVSLGTALQARADIVLLIGGSTVKDAGTTHIDHSIED